MHLSWCHQTWYSAWCSLTTTLASLEPASVIRHIRPIPPAKKAPPFTRSQKPTATKAGTRETDKSMCTSKALWVSLSMKCACQQLASCVSISGQTVTPLCVWLYVFVCMLFMRVQYSVFSASYEVYWLPDQGFIVCWWCHMMERSWKVSWLKLKLLFMFELLFNLHN